MAPRTREELASLAIMHPALAAALEKGPPSIKPPKLSDATDHNNYIALREHRAAMLKAKWAFRYLPGPIAEVTEQDRKIPVRGGSDHNQGLQARDKEGGRESFDRHVS